MKKFLNLILAGIVVGAACVGTACSNGKLDANTLTWYVNMEGFQDYDNTEFDKILYEKTGYKIKFTWLESVAGNTTISGMLSRKNLTDIVSWDRTSSYYASAIDGDMLYDFDTICNDGKVSNFIPKDMRRDTSINGKIYGLVSHYWGDDTKTYYPSTVMIARKDILEEQDVEIKYTDDEIPYVDITSMEELGDLMAKVKSTSVYYKDDMALFYDQTGGYSLVNNLNIGYEDSDGNWQEPVMQDKIKDLLQVSNDWYNKGYIKQSVLGGTLTAEDAIAQNKAFIMSIGWASNFGKLKNSYDDFHDDNPDNGGAEYVCVGPINRIKKSDSPNTPTLAPWEMSGYLATSISKNCKDPVGAMKVLKFLYSDEGQLLCNYGVEGKLYTKIKDERAKDSAFKDEKGNPYLIEPTQYYYNMTTEELFQKWGYSWVGVLVENSSFRYGVKLSSSNPTEKSVDDMLKYFSSWTYNSRPFENVDPAEGTDLRLCQTNIWNLFNWNGIIVKSDWNSALATYNSQIRQMKVYVSKDSNGYTYQDTYDYQNARFLENKTVLNTGKYAWPTNK